MNLRSVQSTYRIPDHPGVNSEILSIKKKKGKKEENMSGGEPTA